ncbi:MAG: zinc ABC transporter substrate-binding protein ZnuA [Candidatus Symbiodolus clandestinus]
MLSILHHRSKEPRCRAWRKAILGGCLSVGLFSQGAFASVVASIRPLAFITAAITEGVMPVEVLLPPLASPHHYHLRPSDLRRLHQAELVIWVGPELESFLSQPLRMVLAPQLMLSGVPTIRRLLKNSYQTLTTPPDTSLITKQAEQASCCAQHTHYDPHIWLSPEIARQIARQLQSQLIQLRPKQRQRINANVKRLEQQLQQCEQEIRQQLAPLSKQNYWVFHQAYAYFETHFGLRQRGHFTVNPAIAPGAKRLQEIQKQLQQLGQVCLFTEPQFQPAIILRMMSGTSAKLGCLDPLGTQIAIGRDSYPHFLKQLSQQFADCLTE